ncbi:hypothetical protein KA057_04060 [Candidatus Gracilibacteria bacterium]|nr:hypothetical protein [Candidatus Gracilibacteria bacterium]
MVLETSPLVTEPGLSSALIKKLSPLQDADQRFALAHKSLEACKKQHESTRGWKVLWIDPSEDPKYQSNARVREYLRVAFQYIPKIPVLDIGDLRLSLCNVNGDIAGQPPIQTNEHPKHADANYSIADEHGNVFFSWARIMELFGNDEIFCPTGPGMFITEDQLILLTSIPNETLGEMLCFNGADNLPGFYNTHKPAPGNSDLGSRYDGGFAYQGEMTSFWCNPNSKPYAAASLSFSSNRSKFNFQDVTSSSRFNARLMRLPL